MIPLFLQKIPLIKEIEEVSFDKKMEASLLAEPRGEALVATARKHSKKVRVYRIRYTSNGHLVVGFVIEPRTIQTKLPCIISNRGGSGEFGKITPTQLFLQYARFALGGYVVVASQYSGNDGGEGRDEMGGSDLEDVLVLYKILKKHPHADVSRIGMYGGSRGGMMTYLCLAQVKWIKAAAVVAGSADQFRQMQLRPEMKEHFKKMFGGKKEDLIKRSAVRWVDKFCKKTPVLMIHGTADWRVSPLDSLDLSREMLRLKIPHRLVLLEGADHGISEFRQLRFEMIENWFERFVKNGEPLPNLEPHGA